MGAGWSCTSKGALLVMAAANGDLAVAQELLKKDPRAALYHNFNDRGSPLIQASARGHFELVQLVLETAVMVEGPDKARRLCIDHCNSKKQSALMVACKHGHPDCVEYLVTNGADPLIADERRHNTCLHFAALYGHSECVDKLLGSSTSSLLHQGQHMQVSQIPSTNEDGSSVRFIDRHNGWGLTALHIAVFQGSVNTVRTLLRHGASLESVIAPAKIENSPIRCAAGSNALHIAALIGNISMAKIILEAQDSVPGLELRNHSDAAGIKPVEYAQRSRNPVLVHLLDARLPVALLRQIWINYSLEQSMPPRHQTLGSLLQKLKLMFNLEMIAVQRNLSLSSQEEDAAQGQGQAPGGALGRSSRKHVSSALAMEGPPLLPTQQRALWSKRLDEVHVLLNSATQLHAMLQGLCSKEEWPPGTSSSHEAVLDFILSTLITPRTVSAILHAAKKLVCSNVMAVIAAAPSGGPPPTPPSEIEVQHGIALLTTALRAVDTCLQAVAYLSAPGALSALATAPGGLVGMAAAPPPPPPPAAAAPQRTPAAAASPAPGSVASPHSQPQLPGSQPPASASNVPASSNTPDSSFTAATAHGTIGTRVPSVTSTTATEGTLLTAEAGHSANALPGGPPQAASTAAAVPGTTAALSPTAVSLAPSLAASGAVQQQQQVAAASPAPAAAGGVAAPVLGAPLFSANWSAQLHSLIAQLHWDIGVQRHRRRRQHAAQQAARAAAAAAAAAGQDALAAAPPPPVVAADASAAAADGAARPHTLQIPTPFATGPASSPLSQSQSRRSRRHHMSREQPNLLAAFQGQGQGDARSAAASATGPQGGSVVSVSPAPSGFSMTPAETPQALARGEGAAGVAQDPLLLSMRPGDDSFNLSPDASMAPDRSAAVEPFQRLSPVGEIMPRNSSNNNRGGSETSSCAATAAAAAETPARASPAAARVPSSSKRGGGGAAAAAGGASEHVLMMGALGELSEDLSGGEEDAGSLWSDDDSALCSICMDQPVAVQVTGCQHGVCLPCAFQLTVKGRELPSCPFCRQKIPAFEARPECGGGPGHMGGGADGMSKRANAATAAAAAAAAAAASGASNLSKAVTPLMRLST